MTFWFCGSCHKTWHSYVITPNAIKTLRCFHCLEPGAIRLKDDTLKERDAAMTYDDYRWFRKNNGKFVKKNGVHKRAVKEHSLGKSEKPRKIRRQ